MTFHEQLQEDEVIWEMFLKKRVVHSACAETLSVVLCLEFEAVMNFLNTVIS